MSAKTEWRTSTGQTEFTVVANGQGGVTVSKLSSGESYSHGAHNAMSLTEGEFAAVLMLMNRAMRGLT